MTSSEARLTRLAAASSAGGVAALGRSHWPANRWTRRAYAGGGPAPHTAPAPRARGGGARGGGAPRPGTPGPPRGDRGGAPPPEAAPAPAPARPPQPADGPRHVRCCKQPRLPVGYSLLGPQAVQIDRHVDVPP